jgi:hypothetical protein
MLRAVKCIRFWAAKMEAFAFWTRICAYLRGPNRYVCDRAVFANITYQTGAGAVASVSFSADVSRLRRDSLATLRGPSLPRGGNFLDVPDFVISTSNSAVIRICMRENEAQSSVLFQGLRRPSEGPIDRVMVAAHPTRPLIAALSAAGILQIIDIDSCLVICEL